jgi:hypothetical protein
VLGELSSILPSATFSIQIVDGLGVEESLGIFREIEENWTGHHSDVWLAGPALQLNAAAARSGV